MKWSQIFATINLCPPASSIAFQTEKQSLKRKLLFREIFLLLVFLGIQLTVRLWSLLSQLSSLYLWPQFYFKSWLCYEGQGQAKNTELYVSTFHIMLKVINTKGLYNVHIAPFIPELGIIVPYISIQFRFIIFLKFFYGSQSNQCLMLVCQF